jgi:hypothetical protein
MDTRPDRDGSETSDGGSEYLVRQKGLEYGDAGLGDPRDPDRADDETFEEDPGHFDDDDDDDDARRDRFREQRRGASGDRARREEALFSSRDVSATGPPPRFGDGDGDEDEDGDVPGGRVGTSPAKSRALRASSDSFGSPERVPATTPGPRDARAPPTPVPPLDPRGASVRLVRRAISDSCSKYCDVLLQVAQDLPPEVLAELKRKAVFSLDGRSQALFSGALAAAFGSDRGDPGSPGADAATEVAGREPDVVAAVAKSVTALLRDARAGSASGGDDEGAEKRKTGSGEAREIARVVLASRTIRSHVEPMLASLLSELDQEEETYEASEDGESGEAARAEGSEEGGVGGSRDESGDEVSTDAR